VNKKQIIKIKKIIGYDPSSLEHKRLLKKLKKEYQKLPKGEKVNLLQDLRKAFGVKDD